MTPHQLHLLDHITTTTSPRSISANDREAVRAMMAERQSLLDLLERFDALDNDPHITEAEWSQFRRDVPAMLAKANGGAPCGG